MALPGYILAIGILCMATVAGAQKVYYPAGSSDLLKSTAQDAAELFSKATNSSFTIQQYNSLPSTGIIFIYDSSVTNNQSCKIESGNGFVKFSASQDNGLCFGIYSYLQMLGFRFYLPGTIWEKIPALSSPYININKIVAGNFKYNNWFISGGHNRWAMDNDNGYSWDSYYGSNGHEWAKYQRRNNMNGAYRFNGHRGDIFSAEYLTALQDNPCYVACYNGSRAANVQSVPDINNNNAKQLWASTIQQRFSDYKNIIAGNPSLYANSYRNFNYYNQYIGIEVSDGANWGNSNDNSGCAAGNFNGSPYPKESDQQFLLANYTAQKISSVFPGKHFQCYAYSGHADLPSLAINNNIDVQVIATAFQFETSAKGLLNRWYQKHHNVSEYHYLNIPQWTGETPMFSLNEYRNTLLRLKQNNSDGMVVEASPAKFASLPFLFAGNRYLQDNISVDSSIDEFVTSMFPGEAGVHVKQLLKYWGDENVFSVGNFINDNKYKIPLYLHELALAVNSSQNADADVKARLQELKAYLHYMILYFDFITDPRPYEIKTSKAEALCLYLAKTNRLQLVNSYFLIQNIVNKYPQGHSIFVQYNVANGSAYLGGSLPVITNADIDNNFANDISAYGNMVNNFKFENAGDIISKMNAGGLKPLDKINVKIRYTNGYEYSNRSEFYFYAAAAGSVSVTCVPHFGMPGKGSINITAEADDKALLVIRDETITTGTTSATININVPASGIYKLSFVSKFQTSADITITTNGNIFFKKGPFYGDKVEDYRDDWSSLPKYFYVPQGIEKLYFSVNNACSANNCVNASGIQNAFAIKNNSGEAATVNVSTTDSSLFNIALSPANSAAFWEVSTMQQYNLCFANISNIEIYAGRACSGLPLSAKTIPKEDGCITVLSTSSSSSNLKWKITQGSKIYEYTGLKTIQLPVLLAGSATINLSDENCSITMTAGEINGYLQQFRSCASAATVAKTDLIAYPNPSAAIFNFKKNELPVLFSEIEIYNAQGNKVGTYNNSSSVNLSNLPQGIYFFSGKNANQIANVKLLRN